jgi:hypothetical protein
MSRPQSGPAAGESSDTMLLMLTMNAVDPTEFQTSSAPELAASGTRLRPHTRWLAAAATTQRSAAALLADEDSDPRGSVVPILDAWTSLVLATWPDEHVPSDMRLLERAEALQLRQGETEGERARTWIELSTLLAARRTGAGNPLPLGRDPLVSHVERLGVLIASPRRTIAAAIATPRTSRGRSLAYILLGLAALALWLLVNPGVNTDVSPGVEAAPAPAPAPRVMR